MCAGLVGLLRSAQCSICCSNCRHQQWPCSKVCSASTWRVKWSVFETIENYMQGQGGFDNDGHKPWRPKTQLGEICPTMSWIWRFLNSTPLVFHAFIAVAVTVKAGIGPWHVHGNLNNKSQPESRWISFRLQGYLVWRCDPQFCGLLNDYFFRRLLYRIVTEW